MDEEDEEDKKLLRELQRKNWHVINYNTLFHSFFNFLLDISGKPDKP